MIVDIPVYYINLSRAKARRIQIENQFKNYNLVATRIEAVDGDSLPITSHRFKNKMNSYEKACTLSHFKAVKQAYSDGHDRVLILEDDCSFEYLKHQTLPLSQIWERFPGYHVYQLAHLGKIAPAPQFVVSECYDSTCAYMIDRTGMRHFILTEYQQILYVSDRTMYSFRAGCIARPYFTFFSPDTCPSQIHDNTDYLSESRQYWDNYYQIVGMWDKIYCINLKSKIDHYKAMLPVCYALNSLPENFFVWGKLGANYFLQLDDLVKSGIVDSSISNLYRKLTPGEIGLNLTQVEIIRHAYEQEYKSVLILEDDIQLCPNFFENLFKVYQSVARADILFLGYLDRRQGKYFKKKGEFLYEPDKELIKDLIEQYEKLCVSIAGFYGVMLSKKAISILYKEFSNINTISDLKLTSLAFGLEQSFRSNQMVIPGVDHGLECYYLNPPIISVNVKKPSLTSAPQLLTQFRNYPSYKYLNKTRCLAFKLERQLPLKIYVYPFAKRFHEHIVDLLLQVFQSIKPVQDNDLSYPIHGSSIMDRVQKVDYPERADLIFASPFDKIVSENPFSDKRSLSSKGSYSSKVNKGYPGCPSTSTSNNFKGLLIEISGETGRREKTVSDILITTEKLSLPNSINIYFPFILHHPLEQNSFHFINSVDTTKTSFCAYMYSYDLPHRVNLFKILSKYKKVDALGRSQHNVSEEEDRNDDDWYHLALKRYLPYKFVIAAENVRSPGYVTEKLLLPCLAGCIPIYWGCREALEIINPKRVIYVDDHSSLHALCKYVKEVDSDPVLFDQIVGQPIFKASSPQSLLKEWSGYLVTSFKKALGLDSRSILVTDKPSNANYSYFDLILENNYREFKEKYGVESEAELRRFFEDYIKDSDQLTVDLDPFETDDMIKPKQVINKKHETKTKDETKIKETKTKETKTKETKTKNGDKKRPLLLGKHK